MGCEKCDEAQDKGSHTYVRVGNSNVLISGCNDHLRLLLDQVRGVK